MAQTRKPAATKRAGGSAEPAEAWAGRKIPASPEAEAAVLGSMILDPPCIGRMVEHLKAESFSLPEHQLVFEALVRLFEERREIDLVMLQDELEKQGHLAAAGGVEYLVRLAESVPTAANAEYYMQIVLQKSVLRDLAYVCQEILQDVCDPTGEEDLKLDEAEKKIFQVTERKISGTAEPIRNLIYHAFESIEARKGGTGITGVPSGFRELDDLLGGLQYGDMIIVAGRPSMGKTSFALNIAEYIGADVDMPVVIFSLEMGKQQLTERFLCSRTGLNLQMLRKGLISTEQHQQLVEEGARLSEKPIFIDDTPGLTPLMIRAKCRRLKSQYHIQAVFIDYLQLMSLGGKVESRQQEISTISRYLKSLARELNVPVVVLSQLNRAPEGREDHRPRMSDLRESGSIEQDADVILLLHRESYYQRGGDEEPSDNTAEVIVAKQRNGPTGKVELLFDGSCTRFREKYRGAVPEDISEPPF
ncbi:MAG TPA: replicative DNA helicase [Anaerohalosphaeraceae bacterium]|nr:replicative DNA helicase [Anaerohalosphaeraceae bacterium]HQG06281.1 replicative DNA helicase [Anaerohalosphaeraceae bacterium]HQI07660.1 replicative DNA helicase [Anaerohalosphaeraceae bacterium]HQJ67877.1 replicative DNA helicase [Anaerohalosphaeraceae bacterium]